jgi:hypothetical protein
MIEYQYMKLEDVLRRTNGPILTCPGTDRSTELEWIGTDRTQGLELIDHGSVSSERGFQHDCVVEKQDAVSQSQDSKRHHHSDCRHSL